MRERVSDCAVVLVLCYFCYGLVEVIVESIANRSKGDANAGEPRPAVVRLNIFLTRIRLLVLPAFLLFYYFAC